MEDSSTYKNYTVEEFVDDPGFRKWVMSNDRPTEILWNDFQKKFPKKKAEIELARQILVRLRFEEKSIAQEEYQHSLKGLTAYLEKRKQEKGRSLRLPQWLGKAAAILLLPLILLSVYLYLRTSFDESSNLVHFIVPNGQKSNVVLADGTNVWLNSGSELNYSFTPNSKQRKVILKGEAFFKVSKDKQRPFLVETKDYAVKVYGTEFNVRAYSDMKSSETILKEGSVAIVNGGDEIRLNPGQRFYINDDRKYSITEVNPEAYISWKDNVLKINNEKLQDLIIRMERWYGVRIQVAQFETVKDIRYTLTIKTESLNEMLELMQFVTPFNYTINGEDVILNYK